MSAFKAVKKPVEIEALLWDKSAHSQREMAEFLPHDHRFLDYDSCSTFECPELYIITLEGNMHVSQGDYVIKGVNGEFYPCKPEIFKKTYDF